MDLSHLFLGTAAALGLAGILVLLIAAIGTSFLDLTDRDPVTPTPRADRPAPAGSRPSIPTPVAR